MQITAFHAQDTQNPQRDYPRAILLATLIILVTSILGTLSVAIVIPHQQISLVSGLMQTVSKFFTVFGVSWLIPIVAALSALGALAMLNSWIIGPSKGLLAINDHKYLPRFMTKHNKKGVPTGILFAQAIIGSILSLVFLFMPSVSSSYWTLSALTAILTLMMYVLIFTAAIRLRYIQPDVVRSYRVPGGKLGMWLIAGTGTIVVSVGIILGFVPPSQLDIGNTWYFEAFLIGGLLFFCLPPLLIAKYSKN